MKDYIPTGQQANVIIPVSNLLTATFAGVTLWNSASDTQNGSYANAVLEASQPMVGSATGASTSNTGAVANVASDVSDDDVAE
ncbi:MAG: hypothetical protein EOP02_21680 [Proteobacteria bacterium]|nr:MAG: hypothetical protein EOP02_21680 [Pseudomonadota bacterium]